MLYHCAPALHKHSYLKFVLGLLNITSLKLKQTKENLDTSFVKRCIQLAIF